MNAWALIHGHSDRHSDAWLRAHFQHSLSFRVESKPCGKMLHLGRGQGLGECVCDHVISQAVDKAEGALVNHLVNKMISHINVLCACVILVIACEGDYCLIV